MPRNEKVETVAGLLGVDLLADATQIDPRRFRSLQNYYPPRGSLRVLGKRNGSTKYNASAIAGATRVDNAVRAWKADGTKKLIVAINHAAADEYHVGDDSAGTFAKIAGGTDPATGSKHFFVNFPLVGKCYLLSGGVIQVTTDFAAKADLVVGAGATDAKNGQFGAVFFSRLVTARTATNPAYVYFFDVAAETIPANNFYRISEPVTALGKNTFGTQGNALREMLMVFGAHSTWYVAGGDPGAATAPTIEQASGVVGCKSPKSFANTPIGAVFLGSDKMVYLVRSDPREPDKIGTKIYPQLYAIPEAQLIDACACYHDGFYKLAFAASGGTTNTIEWWADLLPVIFGQTQEVEWYGPMVNLASSCFVVQDGPDDALERLAGDDATGTVWRRDVASRWTDNTTPVRGQIVSPEFVEDDPLRRKIWNGFAFGALKDAAGVAQITVTTDSGATAQSKTYTWENPGAKWDQMLWDVDPWGAVAFVEDVLNWDHRVTGLSVQVQIDHGTPADWRLRDYTRKVKTIRRMP